MKPLRSLLLASAIALLAVQSAPPARAADPVPPVPGPKNEQGLTATLIANKDTYTLSPTQSGKQFLAFLQNPPRPATPLPPPPAVDLTLRLTNTTDSDLTLTLNGDDSQIQLKLAGNGAITLDNPVAMTMEFRTGTPVKIPAGKTYDIKISSLAFGMRGISQHAYWTQPGDYSLTATLLYPVGEKQTTVISAPAKLKVESPVIPPG